MDGFGCPEFEILPRRAHAEVHGKAGRKLSKPLKYVYKRYTQILKVQGLEAVFECMVVVGNLVASAEWPKFPIGR